MAVTQGIHKTTKDQNNRTFEANMNATSSLLPAPPFLAGTARGPLETETDQRLRFKACTSFVHAKPCGLEHDEWAMVSALVRPHDTVLELGARYGTTSCGKLTALLEVFAVAQCSSC